MTFQLFSANFCQMLDGHFAWQAQYLVSYVVCRMSLRTATWHEQGRKLVRLERKKPVVVLYFVVLAYWSSTL